MLRYREKTVPAPANIVTKTGSATLTPAELQGGFIKVTAEATLTIPDLSEVDDANVIIQAFGDNAITVTPNAKDRIVLNGVALSDGQAIVSDGNSGAIIHLVKDGAAGCMSWGRALTWSPVT